MKQPLNIQSARRIKKRQPVRRVVLAALMSFVFIPVTQAQLVVMSAADSGSGTLRQAIGDAPTGSTITFASGLSDQVITLTSGQLLVNKNLAIDASALPDGIIIDGNASSRIFEFTGSTTNDLTRLTLTNGYASGAVYPNYSGGAILVRADAMLTLNQCTLADNDCGQDGGAIYNETGASLLVNNSAFVGNTAGDDAAVIYNLGHFTVNNSTFTGNSAFDDGGAIISFGTFTLNHCTITGNAAGDDRGGLHNGGTLYLTNSIVTGNLAGGDPDFLGNFFGNNNLLLGDPQLAPLGYYGGPTQTMPPLPGSPPIDAGLDTGNLPATDQRGFNRLVGGAVDIGAVEYDSTQFPLVVQNTADSGDGSMRRTILFSPPDSTITFTNTLSGQTITLTSGELFVGKNLTIDGSSLPDPVILDSGGISTVMLIAGQAHVTLKSLTISGGSNVSGGGLFNYAASFLTVIDSTISGNTASAKGGGIYNWGILTVLNSTFVGNSAADGGAVFDYGNSTLVNSTFTANTATNDGGSVYNRMSSAMTLSSTTHVGNSATNLAGGIFNGGTMILENSITTGNSAPADENFSRSGTGSTTIRNNIYSGDPGLAPLGDYGGPTKPCRPFLALRPLMRDWTPATCRPLTSAVIRVQPALRPTSARWRAFTTLRARESFRTSCAWAMARCGSRSPT